MHGGMRSPPAWMKRISWRACVLPPRSKFLELCLGALQGGQMLYVSISSLIAPMWFGRKGLMKFATSMTGVSAFAPNNEAPFKRSCHDCHGLNKQNDPLVNSAKRGVTPCPRSRTGVCERNDRRYLRLYRAIRSLGHKIRVGMHVA